MMRASVGALLFCLLSTVAILASEKSGAPLAVRGVPGVSEVSAKVTVNKLRGVSDMVGSESSVEPGAPIRPLQDLQMPDGGATDRGGLSLAPVTYQIPLVSPLPTVSFTGYRGGSGPPDTMGAIGPDHVVSTINGSVGIQSRTGKVINSMANDTFWSPLTKLYGTDLYPFDPKILYDRFSGRFFFASVSNPSPDLAKILLAVSETSDPTGNWTEYGFDVDPTKQRWADYPSLGINANWIVVQVNAFPMSVQQRFGISRSDTYAFNKAQALAGAPSLSFTKFMGVETESVGAFEIGGGTWAPVVDADNASPNTMYFIQAWNANSGSMRVSKMSGPVGSETLTAGLQFPLSTDSWTAIPPIINSGWAPQADGSHTGTATTHILNNDSRVMNAVLRGGSIWAVHSILFPTAHQKSGTAANAADHPSNHTAIQWWQVDPSINSGAKVAPIQRGLIEDTAARNCFNGDTETPAQIVSCRESGVFYAYPSIAVNTSKDVLIGFSTFAADDWPAATYVYHSHSDPVNTTRQPVVLQRGRAPYSYVYADGTTRWGDYSVTLTDPANDRDFWVLEESADLLGTSGGAAQGVWTTTWAKVEPPTSKRRSAGRGR